jgi:hypothetical protein
MKLLKIRFKTGKNYLNDIIIGQKSLKSTEDLEKVFIQLEKAKLKIKPTNINFAKNTVIYLVKNRKNDQTLLK